MIPDPNEITDPTAPSLAGENDGHDPKDPQLPPTQVVRSSINQAITQIDNGDSQAAKTILLNLLKA